MEHFEAMVCRPGYLEPHRANVRFLVRPHGSLLCSELHLVFSDMSVTLYVSPFGRFLTSRLTHLVKSGGQAQIQEEFQVSRFVVTLGVGFVNLVCALYPFRASEMLNRCLRALPSVL